VPGGVEPGGCVVPGAQRALVMTLSSSVTAPFRASARPSISVAPVFIVIDASARMFPLKDVFVPNVAELPICQKTLHAWAPFLSSTRLLDAVVSVDPTWKMKTALGSPCASSATSPVSSNEDERL
jgi:hypothetical protein